MKVLDSIVIGNGPASHYIGYNKRDTETLIIDASFETHTHTAFGYKIKILSGGTTRLWGGNLFFDSQLVNLGSTGKINDFLSHVCKESSGKQYESEFGSGVLLPKGYTFKAFHPTIHEPVTKFRKIGEWFEVHTTNLVLFSMNLYLVTGSTATLINCNDGWIYLVPAINQTKFDKMMRLEFSNEDYGAVSMCNGVNTQFISRYRLTNFGYESIDQNYLLKLVHFFNHQIKLDSLISLESLKLVQPIFNRSIKKKKKGWMYLTTVSEYSKGKNLLEIDPATKEELYCRALHTEIFQTPNVISLLNMLGVVHDQKSIKEYGWRFGSVGNQISLLNSRMVE